MKLIDISVSVSCFCIPRILIRIALIFASSFGPALHITLTHRESAVEHAVNSEQCAREREFKGDFQAAFAQTQHFRNVSSAQLTRLRHGQEAGQAEEARGEEARGEEARGEEARDEAGEDEEARDEAFGKEAGGEEDRLAKHSDILRIDLDPGVGLGSQAAPKGPLPCRHRFQGER